MAHLTKFKAHDVSTIIGHNARAYATSKNEDVDFSRSYLNYSLGPRREESDYEYYKRRLSEVYVFPRKDVVTAASWVVSLPAGVDDPETQRRFFETTYDYLSHRYGEENVVQCVVHRDEHREVARFDRWSGHGDDRTGPPALSFYTRPSRQRPQAYRRGKNGTGQCECAFHKGGTLPCSNGTAAVPRQSGSVRVPRHQWRNG